MAPKNSDISQEIYHRIYRLYKKNIDTAVIATTVQLPLKTVQNIVNRFAHTYQSATTEPAGGGASWCDVLFMTRGRYAVLEISGAMSGERVSVCTAEFVRAVTLPFKAFALRMTDVSEIDEKGIEAILAFARACTEKGIYVAILDPGAAVEGAIHTHGLDEKLPVFGTETVFEQKAFAISGDRHHKT
jgi:anti-anti-sigma regulatory factor